MPTDLDERLDEMRARGLSEQQIQDLVNQEVHRMLTGQSPPPPPKRAAPAMGESLAKPGEPTTPTAHGENASRRVAEPTPEPAEVMPPEEQPLSIVHTLLQSSQSFSGPLPPPAFAREYEKILPGFLARQVAMQERRLDLDEKKIAVTEKALDIQDRRWGTGQRNALISILAAFALSAFLGWQGVADAAWIAVSVVAAVGGTFLVREIKGRQQRKAKASPRRARDDAQEHATPDPDQALPPGAREPSGEE